MRPIVTDGVPWFPTVYLAVCHGREPYTKTAEPVEMPFRLWTRVSPRNHVLDVLEVVLDGGVPIIVVVVTSAKDDM